MARSKGKDTTDAGLVFAPYNRATGTGIVFGSDLGWGGPKAFTLACWTR